MWHILILFNSMSFIQASNELSLSTDSGGFLDLEGISLRGLTQLGEYLPLFPLPPICNVYQLPGHHRILRFEVMKMVEQKDG